MFLGLFACMPSSTVWHSPSLSAARSKDVQHDQYLENTLMTYDTTITNQRGLFFTLVLLSGLTGDLLRDLFVEKKTT